MVPAIHEEVGAVPLVPHLLINGGGGTQSSVAAARGWHPVFGGGSTRPLPQSSVAAAPPKVETRRTSFDPKRVRCFPLLLFYRSVKLLFALSEVRDLTSESLNTVCCACTLLLAVCRWLDINSRAPWA